MVDRDMIQGVGSMMSTCCLGNAIMLYPQQYKYFFLVDEVFHTQKIVLLGSATKITAYM